MNCSNVKGQAEADNFAAYVEHGWQLCFIKDGEKKPTLRGWNTREKAITSVDRAKLLRNAGLLHSFSGTCAVDIDNMDLARHRLAKHDIDLDELMNEPDAVRIVSGDITRGKLIYRLDEPLPTKQIKSEDKTEMLFELRCGATTGNSQQDVLPPSTNPRTKAKYEWIGDWRNLPPLPEKLHELWLELVQPAERDPDAPRVEPSAEYAELRRLLDTRDPDCSYDEWCKVGMILHYEMEGDAEGLTLWDEWSAKGDKYVGLEDLEPHWRSFGHAPMPATAGSLRREKVASKEDFDDVPAVSGDVDLDQLEREGRRVGIRLVPLGKFAKREPLRYLVDGQIEVGELFGFIGRRKSGKSYAALDLAFAVAQGRPWAKHEVMQPGPVVWIAAEGARSLEIRRGPQWLAHHGGADIRVWPYPLNLRKEETYEGLLEVCRDVRLVVIDSLRRVTPGAKENSSDELSEVLAYAEQLARETGAAVCFIAHAGKSDATTARGSSAIEDQLEAGFAVEQLTGNDKGKFKVTPTFARDEETGADVAMYFELQPIEPDGLTPGVIVNWDVEAPLPSRGGKHKGLDWLALTDEVIVQLGNAFTRKAVHEAAEKLANERLESFTKGALQKGANRSLDERLNGTQRTLKATAWEKRNGKESATAFELMPINGNPDQRKRVLAMLAEPEAPEPTIDLTIDDDNDLL